MLKFNEEITVEDTITKLPIKIVMKVDSEKFIYSLKQSVDVARKNKEFFSNLWEETRIDYFGVFARDTRIYEERKQYMDEYLEKVKEGISRIQTALLDKHGELTPEKLGNKLAKLKRKQNGNLQDNTTLPLMVAVTVGNYVTSFASRTYAPTIELKVINEQEVHIVQNARLYLE